MSTYFIPSHRGYWVHMPLTRAAMAGLSHMDSGQLYELKQAYAKTEAKAWVSLAATRASWVLGSESCWGLLLSISSKGRSQLRDPFWWQVMQDRVLG